MPAKPDLSMHTLIHFLDRFVYRNPKKTAGKPRGSSIMQPLAGGDNGGVLVSVRSKASQLAPVNTEAFIKLADNKVGADEVFFHKYFSATERTKQSSKKKKKTDKKSDDESESGGDEDEIWKALVDSRPEIEGEDGSDEAMDMDDLDSAYDVSDSDEGGVGVKHGMDQQSVGGDSEDLNFEDDDGAVLQSDDELPSDIDELLNRQAQQTLDEAGSKGASEKSGKRRKRLKNLPTFASVDDYAAMLQDEEEVEQ